MAKKIAPHNQDVTNARVHRFRDLVALLVQHGDGVNDTVYLSADEADKLGDTLKEFAKDVREKDFQESNLSGTTVVGEE